MTSKRAKHGTGFLTVAEAAERLGQSRLRVREAAARGILTSRRDNEGRLRVDIPKKLKTLSGEDLSPDAIIGFLFDELEELEASNAEKDAQIAALGSLSGRQADALDQAAQALDTAEARQDKLSDMLNRALLHFEQQDDEQTRMAQVSGRALDRLEQVGDDLEQSLGQTQRFDALLERALTLAATQTGTGLAPAADRAFDMLETAIARAEAAQSAHSQSEALLARALSTGERLQTQITQQETTIAAQEKTVESAIAMSERALAAASAATETPPKKRGFFRWLFGV